MKPGDRLERYVVEELLGEGGMGCVFRAHDERLQRRVALKVVRGGDAEGPQAAARMLKEARAAAALDHPNAISVFDVAPWERGMYIAMELIQGRSLRALIGDTSIPVQQRVEWMRDAARALGAAHRAGIVHRDIKPENIMIREDGVVKVLDFGIARRLPTSESDLAAADMSTATGAGVIAGTPYYMAPEQIRGAELDGRVDQFAWGVTVYELLCGQRPFGAGKEPMAAIAATLTDEAPSLRGRAGVPDHVAAVIERTLRKAREQRFATMEEVADALERKPGPVDVARKLAYAETAGLPTPALTASSGDRSTAPATSAGGAKRRRRPWTVAAALLAVAIGGAAWWGASGRPRRPFVPQPPSAAPSTAPASSNAQASLAFDRAERAFREGSTARAYRDFDAAQKADPLLATAHLRMALIDVQTSPTFAREQFHDAWQQRERMRQEDRALAEAAEPYVLRDDLGEWEKRLEAACVRFPKDGLLRHYLAVAKAQRGDLQGALRTIDEAVSVEPQIGIAWMRKGRLHLLLNDETSARSAYDRCIELAPTATDCLEQRARMGARSGRCEDALRDVQALVNADPQSDQGYYMRGVLLAGMGRPQETVTAALRQRWERIEDTHERSEVELADRIGYAQHVGRFDEAETLALAWRKSVETAPDVIEHAAPAATLCELYLETGRSKEAGKAARAFLDKMDALSPVHRDQDVSFVFAESLYRAGMIGRAEYEKLRESWFRNPQLRWLHAHVIPARTEEEAVEALGSARGARDFPRSQQRGLETDAAIGRMYALAGRPADALPYLRSATVTCSAMNDPIAFAQAQLYLGVALAATGDARGACDAWQSLAQRWGGAKPLSKTAEEARRRAKEAECEPR